jgi:hypothetical protein
MQTPLFWGHDFNAGLLVFVTKRLRPCFTSCAIVGTFPPKIKESNIFPYSGEKPYNFTRESSSCQVFCGQFLENMAA